MISVFEIVFKLKDGFYVGGTIRTSHDSAELFFHYPWGSRKPATRHEIGNNDSARGALPDHISFHSDGRIHERARNSQKKVIYSNKLSIGENPFNLLRGHFLPIYLESFRIDDQRLVETRFEKIDPTAVQLTRCFNVSHLSHFSLILVSKCARVDPERLIAAHGFQCLSFVGQQALLRGVFTVDQKASLPNGCISGFDTDLVILVVEESFSEPPTMPHKLAASNPVLVSSAVCMPPMEKLKEMTNLNYPKHDL